MTLDEACKSAREGNFISHVSFDANQSMHEFNGDLYYEDGANLTIGGRLDYIIRKKQWAMNDWYVRYPYIMVDTEKLKKLHDEFGSKMLPTGRNYNECIKKEEPACQCCKENLTGMKTYEQLMKEFEEMQYTPTTENVTTGEEWEEWIREDDPEDK